MNMIDSEIAPNAGNTKIYTSGWPKNQNMCWNRIGSPPPDTSKNVDPKLRSVRSMVIPPARTGKEIISIKEVMIMLQVNIENRSRVNIMDFPMKHVEMKLILPASEEIPARCRAKIIKSTL